LFEPPEVHHERLFVVAVMGFLVNIIGIFAFQHGGSHHGHSHGGAGHGHSHSAVSSHASHSPTPAGGHGHSHPTAAAIGHGPSHAEASSGGHGHSHNGDYYVPTYCWADSVTDLIKCLLPGRDVHESLHVDLS